MTAYAKALVAIATMLVQAAAMGLLPEPWDDWAVVVLAGLGAFGVYAVPNREPAP